MTPLKTYDLKKVLVTIGGYRIGGWGNDGGIELAYQSPVGELSTGADGQSTFSRNNDPVMIATITVMETSRSYRDLYTLARAQAATDAITPLAFLLKDPISGDAVADDYATFVETPAPSKAKTAGERVFVVALPNARDNSKFGELINV